jgi:lipid-A-disaccharide synthase
MAAGPPPGSAPQVEPQVEGGADAGELRVFLVAGEASGDALAGPLMVALRRRLGPRLRYAGIGGEHMAEQGLRSLFPMAELSLMGLVEVLPHLPRLWRRLRQAEAAIRSQHPHVVVTVDAPGFNFRLANRLAGSGIPVVHYVAPTVWAWRPGRARRIAPLFRHLLAVLPFEPPWFEPWGLATTYVGHPVLETVAGVVPARPPAGGPVVCLLPGSRRGEIYRLLPVFAAALAILRQRHPGLSTVLPTVPAVEAEVREAVRGWPVPPEVILGRQQGLAAMAGADVALAASGTVTLELALLGTPLVAAYRANALTVAVVRHLLRVPYVTLVNLVLDRPAVPELLQERCRPELLAAALDRLLSDPAEAAGQRVAFAELASKLAVEVPPSERAAAIIADIVRERAEKTG